MIVLGLIVLGWLLAAIGLTWGWSRYFARLKAIEGDTYPPESAYRP